MSSELRSVTIRLSSGLFSQIKIIADKRGATISDTLRYLLNRGLTERIHEENTALLAGVVRAEMTRVLEDRYGRQRDYCPPLPADARRPSSVDPRRLSLCRRAG
jgi:hypothetical protein